MNDFHDHWRTHLTEITTKDDQPKVDPKKAAEKAADLVDKTKAPDKLKDKIEKNAADLAEKGMDPEDLMAKLKDMFGKLMKMFGGAGLGLGGSATAEKADPGQKTAAASTGKCDSREYGRQYCHFNKTTGFTFTDKCSTSAKEGGCDGIIINDGWASQNITSVQVQIAGKLKSRKLHKAVGKKFAIAFEEACRASGYYPKSVQTYVPRRMRGMGRGGSGTKRPLSNHTFGLAIDLNPSRNPAKSTQGEIRKYPKFIAIMKRHGFIWGGDWKNYVDDMHFEYPFKKV
jgi:hypothetical protein